jgi:RNA recognition motif-containing protein
LDSLRAGSFLVTEVALEIFKHPKPDSSAGRSNPKDQSDSILLLKFPKREKVNIIMSTKLYVGNLSFNTTTQDLETMFGESGTVQSTNIIEDRETGRSRGFGFVEMSSKDEAQNAISSLNGKEIDGRALTVNEAKPREDRGSSGGGNRGGGYNGGNRGGSGSRW